METRTSWDREIEVDVVVVGSGAAGLAAALGAIADNPTRKVLVVTKGALGLTGSSPWAQGGVAAAVGRDDSPELHAADTERVGRGLNDRSAVRHLTVAGPGEIERLLDWGARFDRPQQASAAHPETTGVADALALGQEAGHRRRRILHAGGDRTGAEIMRVLRQQVLLQPQIEVLEDFFAGDLLTSEDGSGRRVVGLWGHVDAPSRAARGPVRSRRRIAVLAPATILATGGLGQLYRFTTNPPEVTGDGIAMAARAGARLADLEFVQFHPTALDVTALTAGPSAGSAGHPPTPPLTEALPLLTEALRGDGALLVDRHGRRFMVDVHSDAELAPRDIVARTLFQRGLAGEASFLDLRPVVGGDAAAFAQRFPNAAENCRRFGIDPAVEPVPVTPAAHYTMGGVLVDASGRTSLEGLWACGEVTSSGVHGANRLASNSLLEALVFGRRVAEALESVDWRRPAPAPAPNPAPPAADASTEPTRGEQKSLLAELRQVMWSHAGLVRDEAGLLAALSELDRLQRKVPEGPSELRNLLLCGRMVASAALERTESRGAHHRSDYPRASAAWRRRRSFVLDEPPATGVEPVSQPLVAGDRGRAQAAPSVAVHATGG